MGISQPERSEHAPRLRCCQGCFPGKAQTRGGEPEMATMVCGLEGWSGGTEPKVSNDGLMDRLRKERRMAWRPEAVEVRVPLPHCKLLPPKLFEALFLHHGLEE